MANKFTKSVLERQYLEKQRSGQRPQESRTSRAEKDGAENLESSNAGGISGQAAQERGNPETSHPQGAAQDAVPAYIIPEPEGRVDTASIPAAGIDEAFERADSGNGPLESRAEPGEKVGALVPEATDKVPAYIIPEPEGRTPTAKIPAAGIDEAFTRNDERESAADTPIAEAVSASMIAPGKDQIAQATENDEKTPGMEKPLSDLVESYLIRTPERVAKNKTFYLDEAVIAGIRAAAKKQKVTESKLVNDILRGVLGVR